MYVGMSELYRERDDLQTATQHLLRSQAAGRAHRVPAKPPIAGASRWREYEQAEGDLDGALELLHEAERLYASDFSPNVRPIAALKARVWVAQGRLGEALDWAREQGLSVEDDLSYLREFEHITLARVLLAQYQQRPCRPLHRLRQWDCWSACCKRRKTAGGWEASSKSLVLQALAHQMHGDIPAALVPLERALTLAEPEGYVRIFVDEGAPMAVLLEKAAKHGIAPNYVRRLLTAWQGRGQSAASTRP